MSLKRSRRNPATEMSSREGRLLDTVVSMPGLRAIGAKTVPRALLNTGMAYSNPDLRATRNGGAFLKALLREIHDRDLLHVSLEGIVEPFDWDTESIALLCSFLEQGNCISLNLGEVELTVEQAGSLLEAVMSPRCLLGMIYVGEYTWSLNVNEDDAQLPTELKPSLIAAVRKNRNKPGFHRVIESVPSGLAKWIGEHRLFWNCFSGWMGTFVAVKDTKRRKCLLDEWHRTRVLLPKDKHAVRAAAAEAVLGL
jgi:hypothetical protein